MNLRGIACLWPRLLRKQSWEVKIGEGSAPSWLAMCMIKTSIPELRRACISGTARSKGGKRSEEPRKDLLNVAITIRAARHGRYDLRLYRALPRNMLALCEPYQVQVPLIIPHNLVWPRSASVICQPCLAVIKQHRVEVSMARPLASVNHHRSDGVFLPMHLKMPLLGTEHGKQEGTT